MAKNEWKKRRESRKQHHNLTAALPTSLETFASSKGFSEHPILEQVLKVFPVNNRYGSGLCRAHGLPTSVHVFYVSMTPKPPDSNGHNEEHSFTHDHATNRCTQWIRPFNK